MFSALANPHRFMGFSRWAAPLLAAVAISLIAPGLWFAFTAPPDYQQGDGFRILYVHAPSAWMSLMVYMTMAIAAAIGLEVEVGEFWYFPPTPFDPDLVAAVRGAAAAQGYPHQDIISGAGHDAVYMARVAPSAMVFVPCVGGISHNEIEDAKSGDLTAGCNVLFNAVLDTAEPASPTRPA